MKDFGETRTCNCTEEDMIFPGNCKLFGVLLIGSPVTLEPAMSYRSMEGYERELLLARVVSGTLLSVLSVASLCMLRANWRPWRIYSRIFARNDQISYRGLNLAYGGCGMLSLCLDICYFSDRDAYCMGMLTLSLAFYSIML